MSVSQLETDRIRESLERDRAEHAEHAATSLDSLVMRIKALEDLNADAPYQKRYRELLAAVKAYKVSEVRSKEEHRALTHLFNLCK